MKHTCEELDKKRKNNVKKVVFIGHAISGDVKGNVEKIFKICKKIHNKQVIPCVPYLASLRYLEDEVKQDREMGIQSNLECFRRRFVDELWLFGDRISNGMKQEIALALKMKIPVVPKTRGAREDFRRLKINKGE